MIAKTPPQGNQDELFERPLRLRMRGDLQVRGQAYQGCSSWVIKDPLSLRYFRFREEEYAMLRGLDGKRSLEQLKRDYERDFLPQQISLHDLWQFVSGLHQSGLVIAESPGQGKQLLKRRKERVTKERWSKVANLLAIRFRGFDPTRLLNLLYPAVRWMFQPAVVAICLTLVVSALLLVIVEFHVFQSRLPAFHQFFSLGNSLWLMSAMVAAKILHELGHGLTCKHFGGECHELGLMFLVFTPCLYCNVSDSWLLPNKWHRILIAAAGMYIEVVLAAVCTFLWWFSTEGLFNYLCLNLIFVCSVSTILFNANPLLRFDGYYILADLAEVPNLRSKASRVLIRGLGRCCLGMQYPRDPLLPDRGQGLFAAYAIAAVIYRWVITFSIVYFLLNVFAPYDLKPLGHLLVAVCVAGLVGAPLWRLGKYFWVPGRLEQVKRRNALLTLGMVGLLGLLLAGLPLPHRVVCEFRIEPYDAESVYVQTSGVLHEVHVQPGQRVTAGTVLANLVNLELVDQILAQEAELAQQKLQLQNLLRQRFADPDAVASERELREVIATLERQLSTKRDDLSALARIAPRAGLVLSPAAVKGDSQVEGQLPHWSGYPFDQQNRGTHLDAGVLLCHIGEGSRWEAVLKIDPKYVEFVAEGQAVQLMLEQETSYVWAGSIEAVAHRELTERRGAQSADDQTLAERTYLATVILDDPHQQLRPGLQGRAKIATAPQTLLARALRWLRQTF